MPMHMFNGLMSSFEYMEPKLLSPSSKVALWHARQYVWLQHPGMGITLDTQLQAITRRGKKKNTY